MESDSVEEAVREPEADGGDSPLSGATAAGATGSCAPAAAAKASLATVMAEARTAAPISPLALRPE